MSNKDDFYAYGETAANLEAVMRFHAVKRWHMIDTTRQQTLAEHSANVALLAYTIAKSAPHMFFGGGTTVVAHALLHDLPEVFTGDIPSHTKRNIQGVTELENLVLPAFFNELSSENVRMLIKFCDLADGIRFIRLHGVDITSRHAREGLERQLLALRQRANEANWPPEILVHVSKMVHFYAYEIS